jgi:hypothetical protein
MPLSGQQGGQADSDSLSLSPCFRCALFVDFSRSSLLVLTFHLLQNGLADS